MKKTIALLLLTGAMITGFSQEKKDSTKKTEPNYALIGKLANFQLLYAAITAPGDVTPNQMKQLEAWIRTMVELPETKEADKPKKN